MAGALADYQKALTIDPANLETAKQVEALKSRMDLEALSKQRAPETALKKSAPLAKPRPGKIDQLDQMEFLPFFGPK